MRVKLTREKTSYSNIVCTFRRIPMHRIAKFCENCLQWYKTTKYFGWFVGRCVWFTVRLHHYAASTVHSCNCIRVLLWVEHQICAKIWIKCSAVLFCLRFYFNKMEIKLPLLIVSCDLWGHISSKCTTKRNHSKYLQHSWSEIVWLANNPRALVNWNVKYSEGILCISVSRTSLVGSFHSLSRNELAFFYCYEHSWYFMMNYKML